MKLCLVPLLLLAGTAGFHVPAAEPSPEPVRIGMVQTLFTDVPGPIVNVLLPPFKGLIKQFTGLDGEVVKGGEPMELARRVHDGDVHLGVFHGVEYAWARERHPELRPLLIAYNKHQRLFAHVVVAADAPLVELSQLKGQTIGVPLRTKEYCRLFLEKACAGAAPQAFFGTLARPANVESALDDVLTGKTTAALVDGTSLESYREVKPGCYRRLRILATSDVFPAAVIAYREGALPEATLARFRAGMQNANKTERGRDLMTLWKISAFEAVPADYDQLLTNIARAYPAPLVATPVSRMP